MLALGMPMWRLLWHMSQLLTGSATRWQARSGGHTSAVKIAYVVSSGST